MPIFEYRCEDCGTRFEKLVRRSTDISDCPSCGQQHLKQEFSTFSAHAKSPGGAPAGLPPCASACPHREKCGLN